MDSKTKSENKPIGSNQNISSSPASVLTQTVDNPDTLEAGKPEDLSQYQPMKGDYLKGVKSRKPFKKLLLALGLVLIAVIIVVLIISNFKKGTTNIFGTKGEIEWWGLKDDEAVYKPLIEEYQKKHSDIKIRYIRQSPKDYQLRLINSLLSNNGPDIFEFHNSWVPMYKDQLSTLPDSVMTKEDFSNTFFPVFAKDLSTSKGIIAMPLTYDALTLYINDDVFAIAAKQPPKTWDEFRTLALEFTQKDSQDRIIQSGASMGITSNVDHWPEIVGLMLFQNGANPANPQGEKAYSALKFFADFAREKKVWDQSLAPSTISFADGKVAMYIGPSARASEIVRLNPNLKFRTIPIPQLAKNNPNVPDVTYATYWVEGVWNKSANQEAAWDFLKFLSERDSITLMNNIRKDINTFETVSPRVDMANLYTKHLILSSLTSLVTSARSWYLVDNTNDGEEGINTKINSVYKKVLDDRGFSEGTIKDLPPQLSDILRSFGVSTK